MVALYINNVNGINKGRSIKCTADGKEIASYSLDNIAVGKNNCISIEGDVAEFGSYGAVDNWVIDIKVPSACSEISIGVSPSGRETGFTIDDLLIRLPSDTKHTYGVPNNIRETDSYMKLQNIQRYTYTALTHGNRIPHQLSFMPMVAIPLRRRQYLMYSIMRHLELTLRNGLIGQRRPLPADGSLKLKNGFWYDTAVLELLQEYMK